MLNSTAEAGGRLEFFLLDGFTIFFISNSYDNI